MHNFILGNHVKKIWIALFFIIVCMFPLNELIASDCVATFSWASSTESNVAGYKIYYGQVDGGPYPNVVDIGNPASVDGRINGAVSGLICGQKYYFVCIAVSATGSESNYSNQVSVIPVSGVPGKPNSLTVIQ